MSSKWPVVPPGEVLAKSEDWVPISPEQIYREVTVRLRGKGVLLRRDVLGGEIKADSRLRVRAGEFIISRIDARNGASGLVPEELDGAVVSNDFPVFQVVPSRLEPRYLGWLSKTAHFVDLCKAASEGSTNRVRLKEDKFLSMQIPLPPLDEQRRLVQRIEALATKIEEAKRLRNLADKERQTLFAKSAGTILRNERWQCISLGKVLTEDSRNGIGEKPTNEPPGVPILRISAGTSRSDGVVDEADYKYLRIGDKELSTYRLQPGDLLACRFNGNLHYVGRFSIYLHSRGEDRVYPDKLIRFRVDRTRLLPEFVRYAMNSPSAREAIEAFCATTAGNIGISATDLKTVPVPVPSVPEQREIVAHLDSLHGHIYEVSESAIKVDAELGAMLPAILDDAFHGEL